MSESKSRWLKIRAALGQTFLLTITSLSVFAVVFIIIFIAKDGLRFFAGDVMGWEGFKQMFTSTEWYPTREPPIFGALSLFYGTFLVTVGAIVIAVPLGIAAAVCLSDLLPFKVRQLVKPVIEILAAIPTLAASTGVFAEPAAAAGWAGAEAAARAGHIGSDSDVVVISTGSGLKDVPAAMQAVADAGREGLNVAPGVDLEELRERLT